MDIGIQLSFRELVHNFNVLIRMQLSGYVPEATVQCYTEMHSRGSKQACSSAKSNTAVLAQRSAQGN